MCKNLQIKQSVGKEKEAKCQFKPGVPNAQDVSWAQSYPVFTAPTKPGESPSMAPSIHCKHGHTKPLFLPISPFSLFHPHHFLASQYPQF